MPLNTAMWACSAHGHTLGSSWSEGCRALRSEGLCFLWSTLSPIPVVVESIPIPVYRLVCHAELIQRVLKKTSVFL